MAKILVVYATKYGGTREIAEKIGQVLRQGGLQADVRSVDAAPGGDDLAAYQAVVLGSSVYIGQWRKQATQFLETHETALSERPVWIFSSGPTGEGDPVALAQGWRLPEKLQAVVDRIQPRDVAVFHGSLDLANLNFLEKLAIKNVKAPIGDFRDWEAISAWATAIADTLKEEI
jgi:menaquinone-dependent protoporphyrinogen oxidase